MRKGTSRAKSILHQGEKNLAPGPHSKGMQTVITSENIMHDALKTGTVSKQFKILSHKEKDYHEEMLAMQNSATVTSTWVK